MKILVVNDDGIASSGIEMLARLAKNFGSVTVVAPDRQCSGMSQRLTFDSDYPVRPYCFPVEGVEAYSVGGTPVDCVRAALGHVLAREPDIVFSGINSGYNIGRDIAYSGTVGAALEALMSGVPAIAFSQGFSLDHRLVEENIPAIIKELILSEITDKEIWNVNFPVCQPEQLRGILRDRTIAKAGHCNGELRSIQNEDGQYLRQLLTDEGKIPRSLFSADSDMYAVYNNYISIGKVSSCVLL